MFYVSNISGALVPFEPGITPLSITAPTISSVPGVADVVETPVVETFDETIEPLLTDTTAETTPVPTQTQDAAVYDGPTIISGPGTAALTDALNVGRAGAIAAYRSDKAESNPAVQYTETVRSVAQTDHIDDKAAQSAYFVSPIKNYRRKTTERKQVVVAADIMSSPVFTLRDDTPTAEAQKVFMEHKFRHIPIISESGKLVGIVSDRDFVGMQPEKTSGTIKARTIKDLMVTNILSAKPQTEIRAIAEVMINHHVGCIPITDDVGTLVGILTRTDILHAIVNHAPIELWT